MKGNEKEVFEIDKCVVSRLWYTAWITLLREIENLAENFTRDEILRLISLVQSDTTSQDNHEDRWIVHKILDLLGVDGLTPKSSHVEFVLALKCADKEVPADVEEEILDLFDNVSNSKGVKKTVNRLSNKSLEFLARCLEKRPSIACYVVKNLLCIWSQFFNESDTELQNLYLESLKRFLGAETREQNPLEFGTSFAKDDETNGTLLSVLSKMELTAANNDQLIEWLFPALFFKHPKSTDVAVALYARKSNEYLNEWIRFVDKALHRAETADCLENAFGISNAMFDFHDLKDRGVDVNCRELAYRTIKRSKHWLLDILDICYVLLANGEMDKISSLLSAPILRGLWPTVFFKVLNHLLRSSEASIDGDDSVSWNLSKGLRFVLDKCRLSFERDRATWDRLQSVIQNHLDVVDWVLRSKNKTEKELTIKKVLALLVDHGVLFTLNSTINIHDGSFEEVKNLLRNFGESAATFKAYRSTLCALRAVLLSDSYSSRAREVSEALAEIRSNLRDLLPLDIRLEAIENIFSTLFLRHEDFCREEEDVEEERDDRETDYKRIQSGFICSKYVIRDLLHCLKQVVLDAGIEHTTAKGHPGSEQVGKSLATVNRAIADATWRLELLTSPEFVRKIGIEDNEGKEKQGESFTKALLTKKLNGSNIARRNESMFYQQEGSSSSDECLSKSEVDFSSDPGSAENATGSRKKNWRKNAPEKSPVTNANYSFILNFMLSSKESLIIQCLWKCDFDKAQQVIEMFNLNDSQLDGEVRFSKAMCQFRQRMKENLKVSSPAEAVNRNSDASTLQNIRQAVQEGIQTSRLTSQLETFLASNKAVLRLINPEEANTNEILTMAVLDLALTTGRTRSCSVNACEVAAKYLKSCKMTEKTTFLTHFSKISKLFYDSKLDKSLPDILCDSGVPLSSKKFQENREFWNEVDKVVRILNRARSRRKRSAEAIEQSVGSFCSGENYLAKIFTHLGILGTILPQISDENFNPSPFGMLELSIQSYFGHQFFELGIQPSELDPIAKRLGVNLVHSILVSCCPWFTFYERNRGPRAADDRGYIILNKSSPNDVWTGYDVERPNECVNLVLTELLERMGTVYPGKCTLRYADLQNLSRSTEVRNVLGRTSCLANLNLCELSAGNDTVAFFLNLWNLLFLHSMLTVWSIDAPSNRLEHAVATARIGYSVGDLGLVTLATLRAKLLGNLNWDLEFFKLNEDINELAWQDLDLDQDPRVIFAMANEFLGTPAILSYDSQGLDEALNKAIRDYIGCHNVIEPASAEGEVDICWLPDPVRRYQDFLLEKTSLAVSQTFGLNFDESFTLRKYLNPSEKNLEFKYRPQIYHYEVRLSYSSPASGCRTASKSLEAVKRGCSNFPKQIRKIDEDLLQYFEGHCWLLSYLVKKIHEKSGSSTVSEQRCACFENLLRAPWTEFLRNTFEENQALVGMHENVSRRQIWAYVECLVRKEKWKRCLYVINSMPDNLTARDREITTLKDKILGTLVSAQGLDSDQVMKYIRQMKNIHCLASAVLQNLRKWPVEVCAQALTYVDNHSRKDQLSSNCQSQINATLCRVTAFHKMLPHFENDSDTKQITWYGVSSSTNRTDALKIVKSLIEANKFELCLEWLKYHTVSTEMQSLVTKDLLVGLLENDRQDFEPVTKLLQALPIECSTKLCNRVVKKLESILAIKFVTSYLLDCCKPTKAMKYYKILISVEILSRLDSRERSAFVHLLTEPLLMLEQLLMNGKFEILNKILAAVDQSLLSKAGVSAEDVDKIVRYYAGKSLEFRVAIQRDSIESRSKDSSSLCTEPENAEFFMPSKVPTKEEWVPNDKSRVCSCCKSVVFSMFNRRHHCRRCGRVVCAVCSQQRMRVPTYPDSVHVRVCDDCKRQSALRTQQQPSTPSSETFDYWRLTTDKRHNQTVKDEFSFEHAPSVSLCLAILNLHSDHKAYASFLLDRCEEIEQLLHPVSSGRANPEVDHKLLVKMIRSLLVAAKVKCSKLSLNTELDNCDRLLSHVDLVATLVQSDCSALVPSDNLNEHALRRLRDLLTEKEQWILALDVSTKSGLDRQGVWAAWGKAYLKVGCYDQAREKFAHCLEKVSIDGLEDWVFLPNYNTGGNEEAEKRNENHGREKKTRPAKNPPLLTEILQIIEGSTSNRQSRRSIGSKNFTAHDISVTLNNIKAISQGRYYELETAPNVDNACYHESLHYLTSYGSHSSILEFFIKHEKYERCLTHVSENKVDPEIFFNSVYLSCLRNGCVEKLHEAIRAKDPSLMTWRNYIIFTCHSLETRKYLNTLYQIQLFTKDYVRASMSCIRFYVNGATDYTDLCSRSKFLIQAQKHLETELQAQSFTPKRRKSTGSQQSVGQSSFILELELADIDRHINTISRQMEIAKFLRNGEQEGRDARKMLNHLSNMENENSKIQELPTLFGTQLQKTQLAVLAILCGRDVEEGFGIAFRIIQDYNLRSEKVYSLAGHILASEGKINSVEQLVKCCRSSGAPDTNTLSDRVLAHCVKLVLKSGQIEPGSSSKDKVDSMIKLITDLELKISMCIESRQLKAAYLLAVRHSRAQDVRKIFKEADRLEQNAIKAICTKWLQQRQES